MSDALLIIGSTVLFSVDVEDRDGVSVNVAAASEIKVSITTIDRKTRLAGPYAASAGTAGANWSSGRIVVSVPAADTTALTQEYAQAQVRVVIGGVTTHYLAAARILLVKDHNA